MDSNEKAHHRRSVHVKKEMESYTVLNVLPAVISNVANTIDSAEKVGIRVDWIDRALGEIITKQEHNAVARETQIIRDQLGEIKNRWSKLNFGYFIWN